MLSRSSLISLAPCLKTQTPMGHGGSRSLDNLSNRSCAERSIAAAVDSAGGHAVNRLLMLTLRCTHKLLTRLKTKPSPTPPASTTKLGDWYANTLNVGHE